MQYSTILTELNSANFSLILNVIGEKFMQQQLEVLAPSTAENQTDTVASV